MMKCKKAVSALCVLLSLTIGFALPVSAASMSNSDTDEISVLLLDYIRSASCTINISGGNATVIAYVNGYADLATRCQVSVELQVKSGSSWSVVTSWSDSQNGTRAQASGSHGVTTGREYRAVAEVTVWSGSSSESQTITTGSKIA